MTAYADAIALNDDTGQVEPTWTQGRSAFGGIGAGLALSAITPLVPAGRRVRSVLTQFTAPLAPGPVSVRARVLRSGRAVTQLSAEVVCGGQIAVATLVTIAADRPSAIAVPAPRPVDIAPPEACLQMPYAEGLTPRFTQHFQYHWATADSLPFSGGTDPNIEGWVGFREATPPTPAALLALIDSWPAPVLSMVDRPIAASTVTWMVDLHAEPRADGPQTYRFSSRAQLSAGGYADVDARLWDAEGRLLATSRQLVAEFSG